MCGVIHISQHTAVLYFPCFNHTVFFACRFKGNHIVIGFEEADRVIYGCPLGVQADVFGSPNITRLALALHEAGCELEKVQEQDESLESYFLNLVGGERHE